MPSALLFPHFEHSAVEERYAAWQSELLLHRALPDVPFVFYDPDDALRTSVADIDDERVLVVTDPLLLASGDTLAQLEAAFESSDAKFAVPVTNEPRHPEQRANLREPYMTVLQYERTAEELASTVGVNVVRWEHGDPGMFLASTETLRAMKVPARRALEGQQVAIARGAFMHRWIELRGQARLDLLERIPETARAILEFGCAEGLLGEAIKKRQKARLVGIELDRKAAAMARKRLDDVYCGDVRELVGILTEQFDMIVGGDILEHLDDPWSFLIELRRLCKRGGRLLLSIPNVANWAIVSDLLSGRFDYSYIGITCAGHLRFFTKRTITDALEIAGWTVESIESQPPITNGASTSLLEKLAHAGIAHSREELLAPGYYVTARCAPSNE